jgi:hypothetical protein
MAAAYAAVVPVIEVPSGILADRWSRTNSSGSRPSSSAAIEWWISQLRRPTWSRM